MNHHPNGVVWWRSGYGVGLATVKVAGSTPGLSVSAKTLGKLFTQTRASVTKQHNLILVKGR